MHESEDPRYARLAEALVEMEHLLRRVQAYGHANIVVQLLDQLSADPQAAIDVLCGRTFWGGSGSFDDLIIADENHHISDDFARDNRLYRELLRRVVFNIPPAPWRPSPW